MREKGIEGNIRGKSKVSLRYKMEERRRRSKTGDRRWWREKKENIRKVIGERRTRVSDGRKTSDASSCSSPVPPSGGLSPLGRDPEALREPSKWV